MIASPDLLTGCWAGDSANGMDGLTALDIIVLVALAGGVVSGALRGFVQEALSLAALIVALFALRLFHSPLTLWLMEIIGTEAGASVLAFVLIMGVIWGGGKFAAARIGGATRSSVIGSFDRVLGAGFGALKGLLVLTVGFMLVTLAYNLVFGADSERPAWMAESRSYPLLRATSAALSDVVAERLNDDPDPAGAAAT